MQCSPIGTRSQAAHEPQKRAIPDFCAQIAKLHGTNHTCVLFALMEEEDYEEDVYVVSRILQSRGGKDETIGKEYYLIWEGYEDEPVWISHEEIIEYGVENFDVALREYKNKKQRNKTPTDSPKSKSKPSSPQPARKKKTKTNNNKMIANEPHQSSQSGWKRDAKGFAYYSSDPSERPRDPELEAAANYQRYRRPDCMSHFMLAYLFFFCLVFIFIYVFMYLFIYLFIFIFFIIFFIFLCIYLLIDFIREIPIVSL
jgi:hypothetical protein